MYYIKQILVNFGENRLRRENQKIQQAPNKLLRKFVEKDKLLTNNVVGGGLIFFLNITGQH